MTTTARECRRWGNDGTRIGPARRKPGDRTAAVRELCELAAERHGLHTLRAAATHGNLASARVPAKAGSLAVGPADIGGKPGTWYQRELAAG